MSIIAAKKLLTISTLMMGGGYGSAILYGALTENEPGILAKHVPWYDDGVQVAKSVNNYLGKSIKNLSLIMKRPDPVESNGKIAITPAEVSKYKKEVEELKRALSSKNHEIFDLKEAVNSKLSQETFTSTLELEKAEEARVVFEAEHTRQQEILSAMANELDSLESSISQLQQHQVSSDHATIGKVFLDHLEHLIRANIFDASFTTAFKAAYYWLQNTELMPILKPHATDPKSSESRFLKHSDLLLDFDRLRPIAEEYVAFENSILSNFWWWNMQNSFIFRSFKSCKPQDCSISNVRDALAKDDIDSALYYANQISGWPRLILKDWINSLRTTVEMEQCLQSCSSFMSLKQLSLL